MTYCVGQITYFLIASSVIGLVSVCQGKKSGLFCQSGKDDFIKEFTVSIFV
jgi:hypothetical protein